MLKEHYSGGVVRLIFEESQVFCALCLCLSECSRLDGRGGHNRIRLKGRNILSQFFLVVAKDHNLLDSCLSCYLRWSESQDQIPR